MTRAAPRRRWRRRRACRPSSTNWISRISSLRSRLPCRRASLYSYDLMRCAARSARQVASALAVGRGMTERLRLETRRGLRRDRPGARRRPGRLRRQDRGGAPADLAPLGRASPRTRAASRRARWSRGSTASRAAASRFGGKFYPIAPNDPIEPVPLHGDGWHSPWEVTEPHGHRRRLQAQKPRHPALRLRGDADDRAGRRHARHDACRSSIAAPDPIPYGLGQHPWFVAHAGDDAPSRRDPACGWCSRLDFPASPQPDAHSGRLEFRPPAPLPDDFFDNGYAGWDGRARIDWPDRGVAVDIEADSGHPFLPRLFARRRLPHFCFEPVTHPNNALGKARHAGRERAARAPFR